MHPGAGRREKEEEESARGPSAVAELAAQQRQGAPTGSQSESDPDAPLFALRSEMNENNENNGRAEHAHNSSPEKAVMITQWKPKFT